MLAENNIKQIYLNRIIFYWLRSKYMRKQMVGISRLVPQTTFERQQKGEPP